MNLKFKFIIQIQIWSQILNLQQNLTYTRF